MRVLKHTPWMGTFPLNPFYIILHELKSTEKERSILLKTFFRMAFNTVLISYTWITLIIDRIDDDMFNFLGFHKKLRLASSGVSVHIDEVPPAKAHFMNLDINSLIIFLDILLDDISRLMKFLFKGSSIPKTKNFQKFKDTLQAFEGPHIEELDNIIQTTDWYSELSELRDKPVIHKGERNSGVGMHGDTVGVYFRDMYKGKLREKFMSNLEIDIMCDNVHSFLRELNDFLCQNFDDLPLDVRKK